MHINKERQKARRQGGILWGGGDLSTHPAKGRIVCCLLNVLPFIDFPVCPLTYQCCDCELCDAGDAGDAKVGPRGLQSCDCEQQQQARKIYPTLLQ